MAKLQVSPLALPTVVLPALIKINPIPCKSEMTPFSAVVPARGVAVSRVQIETSLETIYEEEIFITTTSTTEDDDDFSIKSPPVTLLSSSPSSTTCFLELYKSTNFSSTAFTRSNFQCAN
ncbi:hypothetical protein L484_011443 [Morus notabilis]|uniref:Uncharacterized protein n=1 Tax=Morus notabilis TaxID=981085 RepID=W9QKY1_9ROSA|nr:hypothetical protein L484_011443 [Morus notabilis]